MTRGTIAFVDYDKHAKSWNLYVSRQFNGDMGPDMVNGEKLLQLFKEIYFNKKNHASKLDKMFRIVKSMMDLFGYEYDEPSEALLPYGIERISISNDCPCVDFTETNDNSDQFVRLFHYSDWTYLINVSSVRDRFIACRDEVRKNDLTYNFFLQPNELTIFNFRDLTYYLDRNEKLSEVETADSPTEEQDFFINGNGVVQFKKYVEIIDQYHDGDLDCLVVRTSDNQHVLFKQMKNFN